MTEDGAAHPQIGVRWKGDYPHLIGGTPDEDGAPVSLEARVESAEADAAAWERAAKAYASDVERMRRERNERNAEVARLRRSNARLRDGLREIAELPAADTVWTTAQHIARALLAEDGAEKRRDA